MDGHKKSSFTGTLKVYFQLPILITFVLGIASGFPLLLIGSTLSARMQDFGIDIKIIGLLGMVGLPYTFKFLWAPLVDAVKLGRTHLRHRQHWLILTQTALAICFVLMSFGEPQTGNLLYFTVVSVAIAVFSATQDIVIDALRVEMLSPEDQGAGSAATVAGYRVGMLLAGAGALFLATAIPWHFVYLVAAAVMAALMPVVFCVKRLHAVKRKDDALRKKASLKQWLYDAAAAPLVDFFKTRTFRTALAILLFIALFKLGDAMAGNLSTPFYMAMGYTKMEIGAITKIFGFTAVLFGTFIGGFIVKQCSISRALLICGTLQLLSNLVFVWLANLDHNLVATHVAVAIDQMTGGMNLISYVEHDTVALTVAIAVENVTGGMGTAAFVAFMSRLCNVEFTATQYALFSALSSVGRTFLSSSGGFVVGAAGWGNFFVFSAVCGLPGMFLLLLLRPQLNATTALPLPQEADDSESSA